MKTLKSTIKAAQRGFTLIELMIVLAIVGIIAVVAAPIFTDYTIRARVSEASSVFAPVKVAVELHASTRGGLDSIAGTETTIGGVAREAGTGAADAVGEWVQSYSIGADGVVTLTLITSTDLGDAAAAGGTGGASGATIVYVPNEAGGAITWGFADGTRQSVANTAVTAQTLPDEFAPGS